MSGVAGLLIACGMAVGLGAAGSAPNSTPTTDKPVPVVVELYTSEGCSSCPPAETLAGKLVAEQAARDQLANVERSKATKPGDAAAPSAAKNDAAEEMAGAPVIVLAFHVDYWDRLGWKDRFSTPEASSRQRRLSRELGESVYTPMMVVQGTSAMVGSDEARVRSQIARSGGPRWQRSPGGAKAEPAVRVKIGLEVEEIKGSDALEVRAELSNENGAAKLLEGASVLVALVEDGLESKVAKGENAGRTLTHDHVVRAFAEPEIKSGKTTAVLGVAKDVRRERASVIVVAYDAKRRVIAAESVSLAEKAKEPAKTP